MFNFLPGLISSCPINWLEAPNSDFSFMIQEALHMYEHYPHLREMINRDRDQAALSKKKGRLEDRQAQYQQHPQLPGTSTTGALPVSETSDLAVGRPRMSARICYLLVTVRGFLGGIKSLPARNFLAESLSLRLLFAREGIKMPSPSTIIENTNQVSQETRDAILSAQIQWVMQRELDDFKNIMVDSTHTEANSHWPTDSFLIRRYCERLWRNLRKLDGFGLPVPQDAQIEDNLADLHRLDFSIAFAKGKKNSQETREELYSEFLDLAEVMSQFFRDALRPLPEMSRQKDLLPSTRRKLDSLLIAMNNDDSDLCHVIKCAAERVLEKKKVPTAEKITSLSDPDAAFISKGGRETKLGYRPQVSKSESGFVVAVNVPMGNAADSEQMKAILRLTFKRTGVIPDSTSLDDGYTSLSNWRWLKEKGVKVASFSGAKGKKVIPEVEWESPENKEARRKRSAVESVIFQLKNGFGFERVVRRGIEHVRQELTEKVVAFNFYRIQYLLRQ